MELAQQALETQRRQHEQVMGALTRLEQHLTGYSPAMQAQQVCFLSGSFCLGITTASRAEGFFVGFSFQG